MERREEDQCRVPIFLWADEAQHFLHEHDAESQATARSSRIATVCLSQNLANYHANMGGNHSQYKVTSFLGTLATKIFHANADIETNIYASDLIGDIARKDISKTASFAGQFSSSRTTSLKIDRDIRPEFFAQLKTGGPRNNFKVQGLMHLQSAIFKEEMSYNIIQFNQNYLPT